MRSHMWATVLVGAILNVVNISTSNDFWAVFGRRDLLS